MFGNRLCEIVTSNIGFMQALHLHIHFALQNLKIQMKDFEASAEPLQDWLSTTEKTVQDSSGRLHDLPAKRREQQKLQVMSIYKPLFPGVRNA